MTSLQTQDPLQVRTDAPCLHRTLGALAEKCHAYAKALHYRELEFRADPQGAVEALISINNNLRLPEAADGILAHAQGTLHMDLKVGYKHSASWQNCLGGM